MCVWGVCVCVPRNKAGWFQIFFFMQGAREDGLGALANEDAPPSCANVPAIFSDMPGQGAKDLKTFRNGKRLSRTSLR